MIQACITNALKECSFIIEICRGQVRQMAMDELGTRVVQRLIEKGNRRQTQFIFDEVLQSVRDLSSDTFGHHVVSSVIKQGSQ